MVGKERQRRLNIDVRPARAGDARAIADIYGHYVLYGTATFDTEPPSVPVWAQKIEAITGRDWPFLVAEGADNNVLGYAFATQFRDRAAYVQTCENSLYVRHDCLGQGIGTALLDALLSTASTAFSQMIAVITEGQNASIALHVRLGFEHRGRLDKVGLKFGERLDTIYMQKALGNTIER